MTVSWRWPPFITFVTPTYNRPKALAACMASVRGQTAAGFIEHVIVADYVGLGVGGMFARLPAYVDAVHGDYVHLLADDDVLEVPDAVERLKAFVEAQVVPPSLVLANSRKAGLSYPLGRTPWPPVIGQIDLGCLVTRRDVWKDAVGRGAYGDRYEGDYDFASALCRAGIAAVSCDVPLVLGGVMRGRPEDEMHGGEEMRL